MLNNLLIGTLTFTVLLGTMLPLVFDVLDSGDVSVGPPYYKWTFIPISLPLLMLAAVGPLLGWKRGDLRGAIQRLTVAGGLAIAGLVIAFWVDFGEEILAGFGIGVGIWLLAGTFTEWAERVRLFRVGAAESWRRAIHLPRAAYGMSIAHAGLAITVIGITAAAAWKTEEVRQMRPGDTVVMGDFTYRLEGVSGVRGENYIAERAHFAVLRDDEIYTNLYPERRQYMVQPMPTTEAAIESHLFGDLYAVIGEGDGKGAWTVRIYAEPLVPWIWTGSMLMVLGGIVSISDRRYRVGAPNRVPAAQPAKA